MAATLSSVKGCLPSLILLVQVSKSQLLRGMGQEDYSFKTSLGNCGESLSQTACMLIQIGNSVVEGMPQA